MITLIACIDIENGIADVYGNLLFDLPKDMAHFKSTTSGKHVVMGRKTWDSLPNKPLGKRKNYVLTRDASFSPEGATVLESIEEVLELSKGRDVYVIGGEQIYTQLLPHADRMILTHVHAHDTTATHFFPDYENREWKPEGLQPNEADKNHKYSFTFATYTRKYK